MTRQPTAGSTLAIVGDTTHHFDAAGHLCTHAALAAQLDLWAKHFDAVYFYGVLAEGPPPRGFEPYAAKNIGLVPLPKAGGTGMRAKLGVLRNSFTWLRILLPAMRMADAVHLRAPCNVTILAIVLARLLVRNRYAIFTGSWDGYGGEPRSYRAQRWMLRRWFGGTVHAYLPASAPSDRRHIRPTFSPVLTERGLRDLSMLAGDARSRDPRPGDRAIRVVSVGRFSQNKNQVTLITAIRDAQSTGVSIECRLIGDGAELAAVREAARGLPLLTFTPEADRTEVFGAMAWADLIVLPSFREGYPKVLLEGMSAGAIPIASDTPVNRAIVRDRGWVFDPRDPRTLATLLLAAARMSPQEWNDRRDRCLAYASEHTLDAFAVEVDHIVSALWKTNAVAPPKS